MYRFFGKLAWTMVLIAAGMSVMGQSRLDEALTKAIEEKDRMKVMALVSSGAPVNGSGKVSPLFAAVRSGDTYIVDLLLSKGANPNARLEDMFNATPIMFAAGANRMEMVKGLLDAGAQINDRDNNGDPAVNWAAYYGFTDMVMMLAERGADLRQVGHGNAFEIAMRRGHQDLVTALAPKMNEAGVVSAQNKTLIEAVKGDDADGVTAALKNGASANGTDETGRPILHLAARLGHVKSLTLLLDAGAQLEAPDTIGYTALMEAARDGRAGTVQALVARGADVNHHSKDNGLGLTPLHMAAIGGHVDLVKLLAEKGAVLNVQGVIGGTPMLWAFFESKVESVLALIDLGADPYIANRDGISPKSAAEQYEVKSVMDRLARL